jgi:two-component system cell cycle response regulator
MTPIEQERATRDRRSRAEVKILVAEDDPNLRMILTKLLEGNPQLRVAVDGLDAWTQYQADPADILLSDWMMPNMSGLDLCSRVKATPHFCYVILMTARDALDDKVEALECGADEYLVKPVHPREVEARVTAASRIVDYHRRLEDESRKDGLTGLKNRRSFEEDVVYEMAKADRAGKAFCLLMGDVNRFKAINDQYGHQAGDRVLAAVGNIMTQTLRKIDIVFRLGGDEFAAILPECPRDGGQRCVERLNTAMNNLRVPEMPESVGISLGMAIFDPTNPMSMEALVREADDDMYQAKRSLSNAH